MISGHLRDLSEHPFDPMQAGRISQVGASSARALKPAQPKSRKLTQVGACHQEVQLQPAWHSLSSLSARFQSFGRGPNLNWCAAIVRGGAAVPANETEISQWFTIF
jgi:hypothetical protein